MAAPRPDVHLTFPTAFSPFPRNLPPVVPPPFTEGSLRAPFGINTNLYNFALRPEIPLLFATAYILLVAWGNVYNKKRKHEPWPLSRRDSFKYFVVVHNVVLALYSFATFVAMFRAISKTLPDWDQASSGLWRAKTADALCKLHGPRGLGDAATFNTTVNIWEAKNSLIKLGFDGVPDPTDVGRLWNEGLAFWGWMFYVSKFYEVLDTVIILAKGKRSATLQTYHHAGAMLCMWAGIRYMSPPIWMFVFINSAIHAMMYTYFACSALGVQVPQQLKRALTSLQIFQFVFGASYAALHLFVRYDMPISVPFQVGHVVERAASSVSSAATAATKSVASAASSASSFAENPIFGPTAAAFLKKLLLRAAGDEGVAERVALHDQRAALLPGQPIPRIEEKMQSFVERRFETRWRQDWTTVNCIDTSGEAFAIYLNLLYLAPLTFLFARFFIRAYTARGRGKTIQDAARSASDAAKDAKNQTEYSVEKAGEEAEDKLDEEGRRLQDELKKDLEDFKNGVRSRRISDRVGESVKHYEEKVKEMVNGKSASGSGPGSGKSSPSKKASQASLREDDARADEPANGTEDDKGAPDDKGPSSPKGSAKPAKLEKRSGGAKGGQGAKEGGVDKAGGDNKAGGDGAGEDDQTYADVVKDGAADEGPKKPEDAKKKEDEKIADIQATRPGADEPSEEDTDAMGKSGAIVDTPDSPDPADKKDGEGKGQGLFKE